MIETWFILKHFSPTRPCQTIKESTEEIKTTKQMKIYYYYYEQDIIHSDVFRIIEKLHLDLRMKNAIFGTTHC